MHGRDLHVLYILHLATWRAVGLYICTCTAIGLRLAVRGRQLITWFKSSELLETASDVECYRASRWSGRQGFTIFVHELVLIKRFGKKSPSHRLHFL